MGRRSVPPGPILGAIMMSGLAFTLIAVVIARSPYTHGNLRFAGYDRTEIAYLGEEHPFEGLALADPQLASTGDPLLDGQALFLRYGCASCHGLKGQGAAWSKEIFDERPSTIARKVRRGPETMPAYSESLLPDDELDKLIAFLKSVEGGEEAD